MFAERNGNSMSLANDSIKIPMANSLSTSASRARKHGDLPESCGRSEKRARETTRKSTSCLGLAEHIIDGEMVAGEESAKESFPLRHVLYAQSMEGSWSRMRKISPELSTGRSRHPSKRGHVRLALQRDLAKVCAQRNLRGQGSKKARRVGCVTGRLCQKGAGVAWGRAGPSNIRQSGYDHTIRVRTFAGGVKLHRVPLTWRSVGAGDVKGSVGCEHSLRWSSPGRVADRTAPGN